MLSNIDPAIECFVKDIDGLDAKNQQEVFQSMHSLVQSGAIDLDEATGVFTYVKLGIGRVDFTVDTWNLVYRSHLFTYAPSIIEILRVGIIDIEDVLTLNDPVYKKFALAKALLIPGIVGPEIFKLSDKVLNRYSHPIISILLKSQALYAKQNKNGAYENSPDTNRFLRILNTPQTCRASILDESSSESAQIWIRAFKADILSLTFFSNNTQPYPNNAVQSIELLLDPTKLASASRETSFRSTIRSLVKLYSTIYLPHAWGHEINEEQAQIVADYLIQNKLLTEDTFRNLNTQKWVAFIFKAFNHPADLPLYHYVRSDKPLARSVDAIQSKLDDVLIQMLKTKWIFRAWSADAISIKDIIQYQGGATYNMSLQRFLNIIQLPLESLDLICDRLITVEELLAINDADICLALHSAYSAFLIHPQLGLRELENSELLEQEYKKICTQPESKERASVIYKRRLTIYNTVKAFYAIKQYCKTPHAELSRVERLHHPIVQARFAQGEVTSDLMSSILKLTNEQWQHLTTLPPVVLEGIKIGVVSLQMIATFYRLSPIEKIDEILGALESYIQLLYEKIRTSRSKAIAGANVDTVVKMPGLLRHLGLTPKITIELLSAVFSRTPTPRTQEVADSPASLTTRNSAQEYSATPGSCIEEIEINEEEQNGSPLNQMSFAGGSWTPRTSVTSDSTPGYSSANPSPRDIQEELRQSPTIYGSPIFQNGGQYPTRRRPYTPAPKGLLPGAEDPEVAEILTPPRY